MPISIENLKKIILHPYMFPEKYIENIIPRIPIFFLIKNPYM